MNLDITNFHGDFAWLSNFAEAKININGKIFPTAEHLYQASKTLIESEQEMVRLVSTPGKAKYLGRKVTLRKNWEDIKHNVMLKAVKEKFKDPELRQLLINTGNRRLIENNTWHDNFFGNCVCPKCINIKGRNILGRILMHVRDSFK